MAPPLPPPPPHIKVTPFAECRMSPRGVWSMIKHLRDHPLLEEQPEERLRAMAIAFLAFGGTSDGQHAVPLGELHNAHITAHLSKNHFTWRNYMRDVYMGLIMDLLTWLDRLSGGASFMVHTPGTRPPGTPATIEEVKLEAFIPIVVLRENPALEPVFARAVQYFAEHVGVLVMQRWDRAKELHGGGARNNTVVPTESGRGVNQELIPPSATPFHVFYGRAPGVLEALIANLSGPVAPPLVPPGVLVTPAPTPSPIAPPPSPSPAAAASRSNSTPAGPSRPALRPSAGKHVSPDNKPHIKAEYDESDPWSREDVVTAAENMELVMSQPPGAPFGNPPHIPFLSRRRHPNSVINELEARIKELEDMVSAQAHELDRLEAMLEERDATASRRPPGAHRTTRPRSTDTFGPGSGTGKAVAHRERSPSAASVASVSSVSSISASPTPSRHAGSRASTPGGPWIMATAASTSRSPPPSVSSARGHGYCSPPATFVFGPYTDYCARSLGYPPSVCSLLVSVQEDYGTDQWCEVIVRLLPGRSEDHARQLIEAMLRDCNN